MAETPMERRERKTGELIDQIERLHELVEGTWPPKRRCENCGWWQRHKRGLILRLLGAEQGMGRCVNPRVNDRTWRSYTCVFHTGAGRSVAHG